MKRILPAKFLFLFLFACCFHSAYAVKAYPDPIQVIQPDGTTLTIRKHGDEFLNWTTCGDRLVKQKPDGFYYLAEFLSDGNVQATDIRVDPGLIRQSTTQVFPPAAAIHRARILREEFSRIFAARSDVARLRPDIFPAVKGASASIALGQKKFLVILAQFSDLEFVSATAQEDFFNLLNQEGYAANGGTGSVREYFRQNASGAFDPVFDVVGPVTLSRPVSYYGANNDEGKNMYERSREMVAEAVRSADYYLGTDFSPYDNDGDGYIDNVFVYFAGHNEAEGGGDHTIWPHAWSTYDQSTTVDGVTTGSYACTSELRGASGTAMAGIGTYCHEFGHVLGLPDFYDTDGKENGEARGLGRFSLMSGGNYNNAGRTPPYLTTVERILLEWRADEIEEITTSGDYRLDPVSGNSAYGVATANPGEFFLFEYRKKEGWDNSLPNSGLLIYHIDMSENLVGGTSAADRWRFWDGINTYASHQCYDLVEAVYPESAIQFDNQIPFPGSAKNTSFTETSSPAAKDHAGKPIGVNLTGISNETAYAAFTVTMSNALVITGTVADVEGNPLEGVTVSLTYEETPQNTFEKSSITGSGPLVARFRKTGTDNPAATATTGQDGKYSFSTESRQGLYTVMASKEGYHPAFREVNASRTGTVTEDITLTPVEEPGNGILKKHGPWEGHGVGYGSPGGTIFGAVGFSAQEMAPFAGSVVSTLSFLVDGSSADEVGVFICYDNECAFSGVLSNPSFGVMMQVDLSPFLIVLPAGRDVKFGYYVNGSDYGWPLATDPGPMAPMGGYAGSSLEELTTDWKEKHGIDMNIQISATVTAQDNMLFSLGYYMIRYEQKEYLPGDTFTLQLNDSASVQGVEKPLGVQWFFNDLPHAAGDVITLTAGDHTAKAVLTFNGYTQTIVQEIHVDPAQQ